MSEELDRVIAFVKKAYSPKLDDTEFAKELVELATLACQATEHLEKRHSMREVAKYRVDWPALQFATTEPKSKDAKKVKADEIERRFRELGLGSGLPVKINPKHDEFTIGILRYVESICALKRGSAPVRQIDSFSSEEIEQGFRQVNASR